MPHIVSIARCTNDVQPDFVNLVVRCQDGCHPVAQISDRQARLLLVLDAVGGYLRKQQAPLAMWLEQAGPLTISARSSAVQSISRLMRAGFVERVGDHLWLTLRAWSLLESERAQIERTARRRPADGR